MKIVVYFLIFFLYVIPSILATIAVLYRVKKFIEDEGIGPKNMMQNIKKRGLSIAEVILLFITAFTILIILAASWVPVLNYLVLIFFVSEDDVIDILNKLDKIYIIKPREIENK